MILLGGLLLPTGVKQSYWRGTVPLVFLVLLLVTIKSVHMMMAVVLESKRSSTEGAAIRKEKNIEFHKAHLSKTG